MEEGFLLDLTYGGRVAASWVEGKPEKSFFGVKIRGKRLPIKAFRCTKCDRIELYARVKER